MAEREGIPVAKHQEGDYCYYCREGAKEMGERHRESEPSYGGTIVHKDAPDDIPNGPLQHGEPACVAEDEALVRNRIMLLLMVQMTNENMPGPSHTVTNNVRDVQSDTSENETSGSSVPTAMVGRTAGAGATTFNESRRRDPHADTSHATSCLAHTLPRDRTHQKKVSCGVVRLFFCHKYYCCTLNLLLFSKFASGRFQKNNANQRCTADCGVCVQNQYRGLVHT